MIGQILQAVAKVYGENEATKRNAVNKVMEAANTGSGSNGADYSNVDTGAEGEGSGSGVGGGYQKPEAADTSATDNFAKSAGNLTNNIGGLVKSIPMGDSDNNDDEKEKAAEGVGDMMSGTSSDERLKRIFGDDEDAIKAFAAIDAIKFTYNDKAHQIHPNGEHQVDYDPHYGVKAQDLAANPLTSSCVEKDESGYLCVNTPELTMANSAVISEICKRIEVIEKVLGIKVV